ncbi:MAG: glycosyltransferase 87 family protein [Chloroflexota bacterium]
MSSRPRRRPWFGIVFLFLALSAALTLANYRFALQMPGGNDFLPRWVGAHAWVVDGTNPYDPQVSLAAQEMIYGRPADRSRGEDVAHFVYPLPAMIFFAPFGLMPYPLARAAWMTVLELGLPLLAVLGLGLARWRPSVVVLAAMMLFSTLWYHAVRAVIVGQFAVIEALLLTGALLAIQRRRDIAAGLLLSLALSKPQVAFLLFPYAVVWSVSARRWWVVASTLFFSTAWVGSALLLIPDWPILWLRQMVDYSGYTALGSPVSIAASVFPRASPAITVIVTGLLVVYLLVEWGLNLGADDRKFQWAAQLTLVITNLIALRTATTNYVVLVPALCLIVAVWQVRWRRQVKVLLLGMFLVLGVGVWALFLATVEGNVESALLYLPTPALTLIGLWWVRWWARRESRLPLEGLIRS